MKKTRQKENTIKHEKERNVPKRQLEKGRKINGLEMNETPI